MGIHPIVLFLSLFVAASVSFGAPVAKKTKKLPPKKVTVESTSVEVDVEEDIEAEIEDSVQEEPVTEVSATPLENSRSAELREKRRQMEIQTEEKMVQELESSRIEDEQTRRERIFADRIQPVGTVAEEEIAVEAAPAAPAPAPVINITNEIKTEAAVTETEDEGSTDYYLGLTGGLVESRADNVTGAGAGGIGLGAVMPLHTSGGYTGALGLEASFLYTMLEGETRTVLGNSEYDVDQYQGVVSAKYYIQSGWFVPGAGLVMAYSRRQYNQDDNFSNAIDGGVAVSGDIRVTKNIAIGAEYRYLTNLDYERDQAPSSQAVAAQKALTNKEVKNLEAIDYQMILVNGKISF